MACGAPARPVDPPLSGSGGLPTPPRPAGTSGFLDVSWGDKAGPTSTVTFEGLSFDVSFEQHAAGVDAIHLKNRERYGSMQLCGIAWRALRERLDKKWGPSQEDNMAAYWHTQTSQMVAECDPLLPGAAMQLDLFPLQPQDR